MPEKQAEDEWKNEIDHALAAPRMMDALYPRWNKHILGIDPYWWVANQRKGSETPTMGKHP